MILVAGISGVIYVGITVIRELSCVRNVWPFSFASVTARENLLHDLGRYRWRWAAML